MANENKGWSLPGQDTSAEDEKRADPRPALERGARGTDSGEGGIGKAPTGSPPTDWEAVRRARHQRQGKGDDTGPEFAPGMFDDDDEDD